MLTIQNSDVLCSEEEIERNGISIETENFSESKTNIAHLKPQYFSEFQPQYQLQK